jgi:Ca2+-binding EF-hand superfamily protein
MANISEADLKEVFDAYDADKSGEISATELLNVCIKLRERIGGSEEDAKADAGFILGETDKNGDDKISWDEFKTAMARR